MFCLYMCTVHLCVCVLCLDHHTQAEAMPAAVRSTGLSLIGQLGSGDSGSSSESEDSSSDSSDDSMGLAR